MLDLLIRYFSALWSLFLDLWFYMLFGFVLAAIVNEFVSTRRILSYFGGNDVFSLVRATFAGFLVSSCSCGAISLASTFRKRGASTATILTFLLAAPWAGLPMVFVFAKFLGLVYTLLLMVLGLVVAFLSGTVLAALENRRIIQQPVGVVHKRGGRRELHGVYGRRREDASGGAPA